MQKLKKGDNGGPSNADLADVPQGNVKLKEATDKAKKLVDKLDQAAKAKKGRWVMCCGVRTWVEE